jgi:hypothetical protein
VCDGDLGGSTETLLERTLSCSRFLFPHIGMDPVATTTTNRELLSAVASNCMQPLDFNQAEISLVDEDANFAAWVLVNHFVSQMSKPFLDQVELKALDFVDWTMFWLLAAGMVAGWDDVDLDVATMASLQRVKPMSMPQDNLPETETLARELLKKWTEPGCTPKLSKWFEAVWGGMLRFSRTGDEDIPTLMAPLYAILADDVSGGAKYLTGP